MLNYTIDDSSTISDVVVKVDGEVVDKISGDRLDELSNGSHTVVVEATDKVGNSAHAEATFTVDTQKPAAPVLDSVSVINSGNVTNTLVSGTAEEDSVVYIEATDGIRKVTTTAVSSVSFSATLDLFFLGEGQIKFTAYSVDEAGNISDISTEIVAIKDTIGPQIDATVPGFNHATNIDLDKVITVYFIEEIETDTAFDAISLKDASTNDIVITKTINDNILTIDPVGDLSYETTYTVTIPANAIKDLTGNGFLSGHTFDFKTKSAPPVSVVSSDAPPMDTLSPATPTGLKFSSNKGAVNLTWNKNSEADLAGYNVYRKEKEAESFTKLNTALLTEEKYEDKTAQKGKIYIYCVTASDKNSNESQKSAGLEAALLEIKGKDAFRDIQADVWYGNYVSKLVLQGILDGYTDGFFRPDGKITRAEFAKMIVVAMGWDMLNPASEFFGDVNKDSWAYRYIETAKAHGAMEGYLGVIFNPSKPITRAEIAKAIAVALNLSKGESTLTDINNHWAKDYINSCVKAGILDGYPDGTFKPGISATRAEVAKIIALVVDER